VLRALQGSTGGVKGLLLVGDIIRIVTFAPCAALGAKADINQYGSATLIAKC